MFERTGCGGGLILLPITDGAIRSVCFSQTGVIAHVSRLYFFKVFLGGVRRLFCNHRVIEFRNIRHFDLDTYCAKCGKQL